MPTSNPFRSSQDRTSRPEREETNQNTPSNWAIRILEDVDAWERPANDHLPLSFAKYANEHRAPIEAKEQEMLEIANEGEQLAHQLVEIAPHYIERALSERALQPGTYLKYSHGE